MPRDIKQRIGQIFMTPSQLALAGAREDAERKAEMIKEERARQEASMRDVSYGGQNFRVPEAKAAEYAFEMDKAKKGAKGGITKDNLTPAQLAADRAYGKEYAEWSGGGLPAAQKTIRELEDVQNRVAPLDPKTGKRIVKDPSLSGGWKSALPKFAKPYIASESETIKQQIAGALMPSLKLIFPGAVSDSERQALIEQAWNDKLPVEANLKNIKSLLDTAKARLAQEESQAAHYEDEGTIAGWKYQNQGQQGIRKDANGVIYID